MIKKQYSTGKLNWKLDYKNQKYTVTEIISLHTVCFNIEDVHSVFYVNWLCFTADDLLPSQSQFNDQSASIHMKNEKKNILMRLLLRSSVIIIVILWSDFR